MHHHRRGVGKCIDVEIPQRPRARDDHDQNREQHDAATGTIRFVTFTPPSRVGQLDVQVRPGTGTTTEATFTYAHTAITRDGGDYIAAFTEQAFLTKMQVFERKLDDYLQTYANG